MILTLSPADIEAIAEGVAERLGNTTKRLYTVREAAVYLGRKERWVYDAAMRGELPAIRENGKRGVMFDRHDLDQWIAMRKTTERL